MKKYIVILCVIISEVLYFENAKHLDKQQKITCDSPCDFYGEYTCDFYCD